MAKDLLLLCHMIPKELECEVWKKSNNNMQDAANALQWNIYEGLSENLSEKPTVINVMPIGSFPQYYKDAFIKREVFNKNFINTGFCNVKLLRKFMLKSYVYSELKKYYKNHDCSEKSIIVYTMDSAFLQALTKLKKKIPDIKICAVVADLPNMSSLSSKKSFLQRIFGNYLSKKSFSYANCIDGYVLLTKQMAEYLNISVPFCVMEGISTETKDAVSEKKDSELKKILYTGTLHKRFGVVNLVEAFKHIKKENYRLIICGVGDSEEEIKSAAQKDERIIFKGQVTRDEALKLQRQATVLVNPRQNTEEFTKYSFPSKTMEYLSSGKPLVAYKLDGIPDEYDKYINYVSDNSDETLAQTLIAVCEKPLEQREFHGKQARKFVLEQKNKIKQTQKILNLLEQL